MAEKGQPLPKFGEWDVNDPASAEGFTVIFNKARNEKKTGGKPDSPTRDSSGFKPDTTTLGKPQSDHLLQIEAQGITMDWRKGKKENHSASVHIFCTVFFF
ncbi:protein NOI4 isoform X2 [Manihot esculenta]|uniref:protein NOI4 isoform X2 n=1 Tax=Manihot esculenta TaxID=3983 RepID=UPI000B5D265B|nr:protein NOI4 isoform X2 [Manihot esculenta]